MEPIGLTRVERDSLGVTGPGPVTEDLSQLGLVLSLFPGIDLLGRGFELEGACVVQAPDMILGGDVRRFRGLAGRFDGVIGGPPCQDFSSQRRLPPTGQGLAMLREFGRVVLECQPRWYLMENVPAVPDLAVEGYFSSRVDVRGEEVGLRQRRIRHFQFGSQEEKPLAVARAKEGECPDPAAMASEGSRSHRRGFADFCELQGVTELQLPLLTLSARYRVVGNAVPLPMARLLAAAIRRWLNSRWDYALCYCGCARVCAGRHNYATTACRKRMQRRREHIGTSAAGVVTVACCDTRVVTAEE